MSHRVLSCRKIIFTDSIHSLKGTELFFASPSISSLMDYVMSGCSVVGLKSFKKKVHQLCCVNLIRNLALNIGMLCNTRNKTQIKIYNIDHAEEDLRKYLNRQRDRAMAEVSQMFCIRYINCESRAKCFYATCLICYF